jgi:flagellar hook-length control protein FliK
VAPLARAAWSRLAEAARESTLAGESPAPPRAGLPPAGAPVLPPPAPDLRAPAPLPAMATAVAAAGPPHDDALPAQIIRSIRLQWQAGQGEARVQLRPDYLGELTIALKVEQGGVSALLHAEAPEVRRWIEANTATLRDALAEQGLRLDRLVVVDERGHAESHDTERRQRQGDGPAQDPGSRRRRAREEAATPFTLPTPDSPERMTA